MRIQNHKVIEKVLKKGRWHVILDQSFNGRKTMPHAQYVWLMGNPGFKEIPKGYVIHHLDHDEQNDDISNLALMQKHHHSAHHWKQKIIKPKVSVETGMDFFPIKEPSIYQRKSRTPRFIVYFRESINGVIKPIKIGRYNGQMFATHKMAEDFKKTIWVEAKTAL